MLVYYCQFQTLERSYLLRVNGKVAERPQHMLMRVAVGIHGEDIDAAIEVCHFILLSIEAVMRCYFMALVVHHMKQL